MTDVKDTQLDLYKEIVEKEPAAIIVLDSNGIISVANQSALSMLNQDTLVGRKWYEVIQETIKAR